jgi:hypothetical protein
MIQSEETNLRFERVRGTGREHSLVSGRRQEQLS